MSLGEIGELRHHDARVADDADLAGAVAPELRAVEVDLDQLGFGVDVRLAAIADTKVERRAEDEHDVGALQRLLAGLLEEVRMTRRQAAARGAVDVDRHAERIDELRIRLAPARPPILASDDGHRPLGGLEQREGSLDGAGIAGHARLGAVLGGKYRLGLVHLLEQQIERHLQKHRPGYVGRGFAKGRGDVLAEPLGRRNADGPLGDRPHQLDVIHVLERAHVDEDARALSADDEHRHVGAVRARHRGHRVRQSGPRRDDRHSGLTRHARPAICGVPRGLLVPHVDHANALVEAAVVDGHHVSTAEREDEGDVLGTQRAGDYLPAVDVSHS